MAERIVQFKAILASYAEKMKEHAGRGHNLEKDLKSVSSQIAVLNRNLGEALYLGRAVFIRTNVNTFIVGGVNTVLEGAQVGDAKNAVAKCSAVSKVAQETEADIASAREKIKEAIALLDKAARTAEGIAPKAAIAEQSIKDTAAAI